MLPAQKSNEEKQIWHDSDLRNILYRESTRKTHLLPLKGRITDFFLLPLLGFQCCSGCIGEMRVDGQETVLLVWGSFFFNFWVKAWSKIGHLTKMPTDMGEVYVIMPAIFWQAIFAQEEYIFAYMLDLNSVKEINFSSIQ